MDSGVMKALKCDHVQVRWAAATCLGNLAVFHKRLDLDLVLPALHEAEDAALVPAVHDALNDNKQFVKTQ
jgi:hypothetical protein